MWCIIYCGMSSHNYFWTALGMACLSGLRTLHEWSCRDHCSAKCFWLRFVLVQCYSGEPMRLKEKKWFTNVRWDIWGHSSTPEAYWLTLHDPAKDFWCLSSSVFLLLLLFTFYQWNLVEEFHSSPFLLLSPTFLFIMNVLCANPISRHSPSSVEYFGFITILIIRILAWLKWGWINVHVVEEAVFSTRCDFMFGWREFNLNYLT